MTTNNHLLTIRWHSLLKLSPLHYNDVIMGAMTSQITNLRSVCLTGYSGADKKNQNSASLPFVWEIHRCPVNFPHKGPVTRKMFPFDDVIMTRLLRVYPACTMPWPLLAWRPNEAWYEQSQNWLRRSLGTKLTFWVLRFPLTYRFWTPLFILRLQITRQLTVRDRRCDILEVSAGFKNSFSVNRWKYLKMRHPQEAGGVNGQRHSNVGGSPMSCFYHDQNSVIYR